MKKGFIKSFMCVLTAGILTVGLALSAFASNAVIKEDGVRVRSEASTSGAVVTTGTAGQKFEIVESVTGSDGQTWYKVSANGQTGFIRGDLVKVEETASTAETASSQAPTEAEAMAETQAKIKGHAAVNIRSGAGTSYNAVASLDPDTVIVLIGQAKDSAGETWYQLRCESKNVEGFVRHDLIEITQPIEETPEEPEETEEVYTETEEEEVAPEVPTAAQNNNDYEVVYAEDADGVYTYYLDDHIKNQRIEVTKILEALEELKVKYPEATSSLSTYRLIAIIAGILALAFLGGMIFFIFKSRNNDDDEYYDEDDFEDTNTKASRKSYEAERTPANQSRQPVERNGRPNTQEYYNRRESSNPPVRSTSRPSGNPGRPASYNNENQRPAQATVSRPRKPQNFLADDDEFEFEFLNMDDKD